MRSRLSCLAIAALACGWIHAQDRHPIEDKLALVPKVWEEGPVHRLTREEYEATLDLWKERFPDRLVVERVGESREKMGIFLLRITEKATDETAAIDKQHALMTALHGGPERSGTTSVMALAEWLLGDSKKAREIRRKQVVLLMPIVNPYAYFETDRFGNSLKIDPYTGGKTAAWDLETISHKQIERAPEVAAVLAVMDRYQPEVHLDLHGTGLQEYPDAKLGNRARYRGQTMTEMTGSAMSNPALRPWDWRIMERMISAGAKEGFPSYRFEADGQRLFYGPGMEAMSGQLWSGTPQFYTAHYGYARYHTLVGALEIGWEASGVARARGLLEIGNETWNTEFHEGYPVDRLKGFIGHYLTSHGATAAERRRSRVEIWQKQAAMSHGMLYPQTAGRDSFLLGLNEEGVKLLDGDQEGILDRLEEHPDFDGKAIRAFFESGPEIRVYSAKGNGRGALQEGRIENGFGLRLTIPYQKAEIIDLRVNGKVIANYRTKTADGYLHVQIDIPPEKSRKMDAAVVTCAYLPNEEREYGWEPPAEVRSRIER